MKYIYLTESGNAQDLKLPKVDAGLVDYLSFLDLKAFKKLRKKIKAICSKNIDTKEANQKIVIIYSSPVSVIASGLRCKIEPEQLVSQWIQQAETLVELYKQHQPNCILANINALKVDINELAKLVSMSKKERAVFSAISQGAAEADINTLSAYYLVENNDSLKRQLLILDACTTFNESSEDVCNIQHILHQQSLKSEQSDSESKKTQLALEQQQAEVRLLNKKIETLSDQAAQENKIANETKIKHDLDAEKFQNTIKQLSEEKNELNIALKNAQSDLIKQTDENKQIIKQLHLVQEAFEESIINANTLKSGMLTLENKKSTLQKQLERNESHQAWLVKELLASHKQLNAKSWSYRSLLKKQVALIKDSGLFDESWYLESYPDVVASKLNPILHYLLYGVIEAKNPSPEFNTKNYLSIYIDVGHHGMNPFIHYIKFGQGEGRKADPLQKRLPAPTQP